MCEIQWMAEPDPRVLKFMRAHLIFLLISFTCFFILIISKASAMQKEHVT